MNGEPADTPAAQSYIAFIAVLGLVGAAVARGRVADWGARSRRRRSHPGSRARAAVLLLGVAAGTGRWLVEGNLQTDGTAGIVTTLYFLLRGLLFSTLGWKADGRRGGV